MPITNKEVWSDLEQNFVVDGHGSIRKVVNVESVFTSIDNILGTSQGERVMLPEFASTLSGIVFDPVNQITMDNLAKSIRSCVEKWDNRVSITQVDFKGHADQNTIIATIIFRIKGYSGSYVYTKALKTGGV